MDQHFLTNGGKIERLIALLQPQPGQRVVELGAGTGSVAEKIPKDVSLSLVELDPLLAGGLRQRFSHARVLQGDALTLLASLSFDSLLSNLPHYLTDAVMHALTDRRFLRALVTVCEGHPLEAFEGRLARARSLRLEPEDFTPTQPFASQVYVVTPKVASRPR